MWRQIDVVLPKPDMQLGSVHGINHYRTYKIKQFDYIIA